MDLLALERPAVGLFPKAMQNGQLVLQEVCPLPDFGEAQTQLAVLRIVPTGSDTHLYAPAAHLVDRGHNLGEGSRVPERNRRDKRSEADRGRLAGDSSQDCPGVGGWFVGRAGEASVVVRTEERLEAEPLGQTRHLELFGVRESLLRFGHEREIHRNPPARLTNSDCRKVSLNRFGNGGSPDVCMMQESLRPARLRPIRRIGARWVPRTSP